MTAIGRLARALGALAALAGLLAGVPYLLTQIGTSPLRPADSLSDALGDLVTGPLDDHTALGLVTVAIWALWTLFAVCVTREFAYALRGGTSHAASPLRFTGPVQLVAHRLVASIVLIGLTTTTTGPSPLPVRPAEAQPVAVVTDPPPYAPGAVPVTTPAATPITTGSATPAAPAPQADEALITVTLGDTAWDLAETHLGDGMRWQELWTLNHARPQPDGRTWTDPGLLLPGWELALPASSATPSEVTGSGTAISVRPGDTAWDLAETHLGDGMRWQELWTLNHARLQADGRVWSDPEALTPGWTLDLPAIAAAPLASVPALAPTSELPQPAEAEEPSDTDQLPTAVPDARPSDAPSPPDTPTTTATTESRPATTVAPAPALASTPDPGEEDADEADSPVAQVGVLGAAGTVLAVAVLRSLRRRRAQRSARLPVTVMPPPPPRATRVAAREVLSQADEAAVDRLDAALANLAAGLHPRGGEPCVQPRLIQRTGARIEVLLDRANPEPPAPWRPEASGQIWVLDPDVELPPTEAGRPLPALVTLGVGTADILIDLEAYGIVSLTGDTDACWALANSMITELALRSEGTLGIEVIGHELHHHVADLDGVDIVDSWDDIDTGTITGSARMLDAGRWPHTFAARASGRMFDGWAPMLWICTPSDHPRYHTTVAEVEHRPGAGSAIVIAGADDTPHGLRIDLAPDGTFHIPALGLTGQAQQLAVETVEHVVDLLEDAGDAALAPTLPFPTPPRSTDQATTPDPGPQHATTYTPATPSGFPDEPASYQDPDYKILVRVCGEIHVQGGRATLPPRESAVATYIALHGEADLDQIRDAVWGGTDVSRKRVRNVVSSVRRSLGDAISFIDEGRVKAGDHIVTDIDLIRRRLAYAHHQDDPEARAHTLRGALEWVTGKVCTYPSTARRSWTWIDLDNWISNVESLVGTVAHDLATLYLQLGNPTQAAWAARRGTEATGPREQLTLLLVESYELAGDQPAAASALRSYERHMADLGADEHSDQLLALMDRHLPARTRDAG